MMRPVKTYLSTDLFYSLFKLLPLFNLWLIFLTILWYLSHSKLNLFLFYVEIWLICHFQLIYPRFKTFHLFSVSLLQTIYDIIFLFNFAILHGSFESHVSPDTIELVSKLSLHLLNLDLEVSYLSHVTLCLRNNLSRMAVHKMV